MNKKPLGIIHLLVIFLLVIIVQVACRIETPRPPTPISDNGTNPFPTATAFVSTQPPRMFNSLEGLYIGRYPRGEKAVAYLFKPSGAVAYDFYQSVVDPDLAAGWPMVEVYVEKEAVDKGYEPYRVSLGTFHLLGDRIRLDTQEMYIDTSQQVKFRETVYGDTFDQKGEELSFSALPDFSAVTIDGAVLIRQGDLTGTRLSGHFV